MSMSTNTNTKSHLRYQCEIWSCLLPLSLCNVMLPFFRFHRISYRININNCRWMLSKRFLNFVKSYFITKEPNGTAWTIAFICKEPIGLWLLYPEQNLSLFITINKIKTKFIKPSYHLRNDAFNIQMANAFRHRKPFPMRMDEMIMYLYKHIVQL